MVKRPFNAPLLHGNHICLLKLLTQLSSSLLVKLIDKSGHVEKATNNVHENLACVSQIPSWQSYAETGLLGSANFPIYVCFIMTRGNV